MKLKASKRHTNENRNKLKRKLSVRRTKIVGRKRHESNKLQPNWMYSKIWQTEKNFKKTHRIKKWKRVGEEIERTEKRSIKEEKRQIWLQSTPKCYKPKTNFIKDIKYWQRNELKRKDKRRRNKLENNWHQSTLQTTKNN